MIQSTWNEFHKQRCILLTSGLEGFLEQRPDATLSDLFRQLEAELDVVEGLEDEHLETTRLSDFR